jgi:cell division protein FtsB
MSAPTSTRDQRRQLRRHGRRRRRGGEGRAPVPVQRAARRAVNATSDGGRRAWGAASNGDRPMVVALMLVLALGATMLAGPTQRYLDSSSRVDDLEVKAAALEAENEKLRQRREDLTDEEYVELLAREQQGLVRPGEIAYTLVPPEVDRPRISTPRDPGESESHTWYVRAWDSVRGWFA